MINKSNAVRLALACVAAVLLLSVVSCTPNVGGEDDLSSKWREIWSCNVTVKADSKSLFSFDSPKLNDKVLSGGSKHEITITNGESTDCTVYLPMTGESSLDAAGGFSSVEIPAGETYKFDFVPQEDTVISECIGISVGSRAACFVGSYEAFSKAVDAAVFEAVILTDDISSSGGLTVDKPIKIITAGNVLDAGGKLGVVTEDEGSVEFCLSDSKGIKCDGFFADAPNCDITVNREFFDLGDKRDFYLGARSYNSHPLSPNTKHIKDTKMLELLLDESEYPKLRHGMTVYFIDGFKLESDALITSPVTLIFSGNFTSDHRLTVRTDEEGVIELKNIGDAEITSDMFEFLAPECDLKEYGCDITMVDLLTSSELRSFNGVLFSECILGGDGSESLYQLTMMAENNRNLASDVVWTAYGDYLHATISCVVDPETLHRAELTPLTSGGSVSFVSASGESGKVDLLGDTGVFCTVTDDEGEIRRYAVITEYIPTKLPVVVIDVDRNREITSNEDYLPATIRIDCRNLSGEFPSLTEKTVSIRGRGNSTWEWPKKPYKLKFDSKTSVLGMTANKDWTLLANYADKSLIRNHVALVMAKTLDNMPFATSQYPVDLFMNGKYLGVYTLGEQVEVKKDRVDIEVDENTNILDTGYLLQIGGTTSYDTWDVTCFRTDLLRYVKVEAPKDDFLTRARVQYIKDFCLKADAAVVAREGYEEYIDVDALIDWAILHELAYNLDSCFHRSCFFIKQTGGKLQMGPAWDFDLALGNMSRDANKYNIWLIPGKNDKDAYIKLNWLNYLYCDEAFCRRMEARWNEIKDVLLEDSITAIDIAAEKVAPSAKDNFELWKILGVKVAFEPSYTNQYDTYEKQIGYLKSFINNRWKWIDENISSLPLTPEETDILPKTETAEAPENNAETSTKAGA